MSDHATTNVNETRVFYVPSGRVDALEKTFAALARRAAKLNCSAPSLDRIGAVRITDHWDAFGLGGQRLTTVRTSEGQRPELRPGQKVEGENPQVMFSTRSYGFQVRGEAVRIAGWELLARIEHPPGERNFVFVVPGYEAGEAWFTAKPDCDHCGHDRRRKDTYLVQNVDTGEMRQVGKTCMRDFLGHAAPEQILAMAELVFAAVRFGADNEDLDGTDHQEWECPDMRPYITYGSHAFLARVSAWVRGFGWTSGKAAYENNATSTKDCVLDWIGLEWARDARSREQLAKIESTTGGIQDQDRAAANAALAWARDELEPRGDYEQNLKSCAVNEETTYRGLGILASLIVVHGRHVEREIARTKLAKGWAKGHVGEVGERLVFEGEVLIVRHLDSDYGPKALLGIKVESGHQVSTFATSAWAQEVNVGDHIKIKATIRKHDNYRDVDQTVVTRAALLEKTQ